MTFAEYHKERRTFLKGIGICLNCGRHKAIQGRISCPRCREKINRMKRLRSRLQTQGAMA